MTPAQYKEAVELFEQLRELPLSQRASALARASEDVRSEVLRLLDADRSAEAGAFLERGAMEDAARLMPAQAPAGASIETRAGQRLVPGTKVGPYEIIALLGAGGMGEVYRARDPRLARDVALKILPREVADDPSRRQRFEREARALAALSHPHIVSIYDIGDAYIVTELVDGEPLSSGEHLEMSRLIEIAIQIAGGLAAAHDAGIVHRDLKPANILIARDGNAKILDFGLAKLHSGAHAALRLDSDPAQPPTEAGIVLGTVGYMSPEQVRGLAADHRADIFSFGVILYELLTGGRAFQGETSIDTMQAILRREPPALPEFVPVPVRQIVTHCLEKDPRKRFQSAHDLRFALSSLVLSGGGSVMRADTATGERSGQGGILQKILLSRVLAAVALIAAGAAGTLLLWPSRPAGAPDGLIQLDLDVGEEVSELAISNDGSQIVFLKGNQLVLRRLDQAKTIPLEGTDGAVYPFFSPDGKWVAFFSRGKLRKIGIAGGAPASICDARSWRGGSWGDDDEIVAQLNGTGGLFAVSSSGSGQPHPLTDLTGESHGVTSHRWPQSLPGGKGVLYTAGIAGTSIGSLRVLAKNGKTTKTLVENSPYGRFVAGGYVIYYQDGKLFGVPFNLDRLELSGTPVLLVDHVAADTVRGAAFESSLSGTVAYRAGNEELGRAPFWLDSSSTLRPLGVRAGTYVTPRLSPDGKNLAVAVAEGGEYHIWIHELASGRMKRLTYDDSETELLPVWSPEGAYIAFQSGSSIAWVRADGSGKVDRLPSSKIGAEPYFPYSFSPDGKYLAFSANNSKTGLDLYVAPVEISGSGEMKLGAPEALWSQGGGQYSPAISPDGRWLAYTSTENAGRSEVFVTSFAPGRGASNSKWQISGEGGTYPVWSRDGRQLWYRSADRHVMVAHCRGNGDSFRAEQPRQWAVGRRLGVAGGLSSFDVAAGDPRVLGVFESADDKPETHLRVLLNAGAELRRRVAAAR